MKKTIFLVCAIPILLAVPERDGEAQRRAANGPRSGMLRVGVDIGANGFGSDFTKTKDNYRFRTFGGIGLEYLLSPVFTLGVFANTGGMEARYMEKSISNTFFTAGVATSLRWPIARGSAAPYVIFRLGGLFFQPRWTTETYESIGEKNNALTFGGGIGFEYIIKRQVGIRLELGSQLTSSDELDNLVSGPQNDGYSYLSFGVSYYFAVSRTAR
jgi:hypothetical protein